jgi:hypothetical protein
MAHFAKLGIGNIVEQVIVVSNDVAKTEQDGVDFINQLYNTQDVWKQVSYNTVKGVHLSGKTPFRKNYPSVGYFYDEVKDAFIPPKPFNSWILNENTCIWESPVPYPEDGNVYNWDEDNLNWKLI